MPCLATAQNGRVAIGQAQAHSSAILDVHSLDKGMLVPRLTSMQRIDINAPAQGLLVYDVDVHGFFYYNGNQWVAIQSSSLTSILDLDQDTGIDVEGSGDEDRIFFTIQGIQEMVLEKSRLSFPDGGNSILIGTGAGEAELLSPNGNVFIGNFSGLNSTLGNNIGIGNNSLQTNTGMFNVAVGGSALFNNIASGITMNTAVGWESMFINSGVDNVGLGYRTLNFNSSDDNVAIGSQVLSLNTGDGQNVIIGSQAMGQNFGDGDNTAIGFKAIHMNVSGSKNVAIGSQAMEQSDNGIENVSLGYQSQQLNQDGHSTVAVGARAAQLDTISEKSVYIGYEAGAGLVSHHKTGNIHIGYQAGKSNVLSNKLFIDNHDTIAPLIWADLSSDSVIINGKFGIRGEYTFPDVDGNAGKVLKTNGNGQLLWTNDNTADNDAIPTNELITQLALIQDTIRIQEGGVVSTVGLNDLRARSIADDDNDTVVTTEETAGDNRIRMKVNNNDKMVVNNQGVIVKSTLKVEDVLYLQPITQPTNPVKGMMYFDDNTNKLRVYDGNVWKDCF
jgi:hypothetical protein